MGSPKKILKETIKRDILYLHINVSMWPCAMKLLYVI